MSLSRNHIVVFIAGLLAACISFMWYGLVYYKGFNSDMAIHVLMAEDFQFSRDLYFRGQSRLGSLIPMLASLLVALGINAVWAVSIITYTLMFGNFVMLQTFLKKTWTKLALAVTLFFPNWAFIEQILPAHPYVSHLFFLSILLVLFHSQLKNDYKYPLMVLSSVFMIWTSEMALINIIILIIVWFNELRKEVLSNHKVVLWSFITLILGSITILWVKLSATGGGDYNHFLASKTEFFEAVKNFKNQLLSAVSYGGNKPPVFWLTWLLVVLTGSLLVIRRKPVKLAWYFILCSLASVGMVWVSHWASLNYYPHRYYTPAYLQFIFFLLLMADVSRNWFIIIPTVLSCIISSYSGYYLINHFSLEVDDRLNRIEMNELIDKGKTFGVLASYWNSYPIDALSENIVATPDEYSYNRIPERTGRVFEQDSVLVIRNGFLETLPDTLLQHGHKLLRISDARQLNEFDYAFYKVIE